MNNRRDFLKLLMGGAAAGAVAQLVPAQLAGAAAGLDVCREWIARDQAFPETIMGKLLGPEVAKHPAPRYYVAPLELEEVKP